MVLQNERQLRALARSRGFETVGRRSHVLHKKETLQRVFLFSPIIVDDFSVKQRWELACAILISIWPIACSEDCRLSNRKIWTLRAFYTSGPSSFFIAAMSESIILAILDVSPLNSVTYCFGPLCLETMILPPRIVWGMSVLSRSF